MTSKNLAIREDIEDALQEGKRRPMSYAGSSLGTTRSAAWKASSSAGGC